MRGVGWIGVVLALGGCGRSGFLVDEGPLDGGGEGDERGDDRPANDDDRPNPEDDDEAGDEIDDEGAFVPPPDIPMDTPPDPSCGNGQIDPGELCYLPRVGYPSRIDPCALALGDLDDDGHLDVAVPNSDFTHLESPENWASILLGDGDGHLGDPLAFLAGGDFAVGVAIGDLDNDGRDDLVIANNEVASLSVLLADGPANFNLPTTIAVGEQPVTSALADLDHDGDLDVAATNLYSNEIRVGLGRGDGTFEPTTSYAVNSPWEVVLADIDGDGNVDMASTEGSNGSIVVWRGQGDGAFVTGVTLDVDQGPLGLAAADIDGNGQMDLVSANQVGATVSVFQNMFETLLPHDPVPVGMSPRSIAVADLDMDGRPDAAVADDILQVVHVLVGDGNGVLEPVALYGSGMQPSTVRVGDLNEDGVPDLLTSDQYSNEVGVILSNP
jgi:hypothetical protein